MKLEYSVIYIVRKKQQVIEEKSPSSINKQNQQYLTYLFFKFESIYCKLCKIEYFHW